MPAPAKLPTATHALKLREAAKSKRNTAGYLASIGDPTGARWEGKEADEADERADEILTLPEKPAIGTGGELQLSKSEAAIKPGLACTVEDPTLVTVEASRDRLVLTSDAQCLAQAVDAAETIQAQNSLEKMLAHQMAAAHSVSMRLIARAEDEFTQAALLGAHTRHECHLSATRLLNTSARLMSSFQTGMLALNKVRTGGQQTVTVQHVNVSDGGQAVVTGAMQTGGQG